LRGTRRLGFGCYRVDDRTPAQRQALERALGAGCRLIDTSTNYTDGGSERLVGAVLSDFARRDPAARADIHLVTKIGYVQGANLDLAIERERAGRPFPEMVRYMDGCWHCIHPEFLRDQLARSRSRLGVERIDTVLLHNPEYFLSDAQHRGGTDAAARDTARTEFYRRLREAFGFLEDRATAGEIGAYGVSSNTAVVPAGDFEATSVSRMLEAAVAAGGPGHHFRVLQLPMNLFETGAPLERNTGPDATRTPLEEALAAGLEVLVNRPLNAIAGGRLVRLAEGHPLSAAIAAELDPLLPPGRRTESLSRKAIWAVTSTPGVTTVLVGMRRPEYVDDAMAIAAWEPLPDPLAVHRRFRTLAGA
jgi:aryl-alcohol dehydrogenase-like predicted oxidoreductase